MDEHQGALTPAPYLSAVTSLPDRVRLPIRFDPAPLREDLEKLGDAEWTPHFVPQHFVGQWSALPLRAPAGAAHPILRITANPETTAWETTEWLDRCEQFREVVSRFRCPIASVRLMRLAPDSSIREHRDDGLAAELGSARLHVPIITNERAQFRLNGVPVPMAPGELWYLRLSDPHSAVNRGADARIHLIIDIKVNRWFEDLLEQGMRVR